VSQPLDVSEARGRGGRRRSWARDRQRPPWLRWSEALRGKVLWPGAHRLTPAPTLPWTPFPALRAQRRPRGSALGAAPTGQRPAATRQDIPHTFCLWSLRTLQPRRSKSLSPRPSSLHPIKRDALLTFFMRYKDCCNHFNNCVGNIGSVPEMLSKCF